MPGNVVRGQIHAGGGYQELLSGDISMPAVSTRNCCQGTDPCRRWVPGTVVRGQTNAGGEYQELFSGDRPMPAVDIRNCCQWIDTCWP